MSVILPHEEVQNVLIVFASSVIAAHKICMSYLVFCAWKSELCWKYKCVWHTENIQCLALFPVLSDGVQIFRSGWNEWFNKERQRMKLVQTCSQMRVGLRELGRLSLGCSSPLHTAAHLRVRKQVKNIHLQCACNSIEYQSPDSVLVAPAHKPNLCNL